MHACAGVGDFDASLFRVSSAEAAAMDAQQRLLLEVSQEVIAAAIPPGSKAKVSETHSPVMLRFLSPATVQVRNLQLKPCAVLQRAGARSGHESA